MKTPNDPTVASASAMAAARQAATRILGGRAPWWWVFGIDARALAAFRIAVGCVLLGDLFVRATFLSAMYTDAGIFPRTVIVRHLATPWNWSFHLGGGSWGFQAGLFGLAGALAVALVAGYRTRLATIGSWLLLVSLHHRVPPILSGADVLLRMLLFWGMFLPLGREWSVDGWRARQQGTSPSAPPGRLVVSVASVGMLLQMPQMYFFSAIFKSNAEWMRGDVLAGALMHDFYASPMGSVLLHYPGMLRGLTWWTLALEWVAPVLFFVPRFTTALRLFCVGSLAALHLGILVFLEVDLFSFVALAGLIVFLPPPVWNRCVRPFLAVSAPDAGSMGVAPPARPSRGSMAAGVCCGLALAYVVTVNVAGLPGQPLGRLTPSDRSFPSTALGWGQKWNMFEVVPSKSGWYVAWARLNDGSEVDLLRGGRTVDWSRPAFPVGIYPNHRWKKLLREMAYDDALGYHVFRKPVAQYLCRAWNLQAPADRRIAEFELVFCLSPVGGSRGAVGRWIEREKLVSFDYLDAAVDPTATVGL